MSLRVPDLHDDMPVRLAAGTRLDALHLWRQPGNHADLAGAVAFLQGIGAEVAENPFLQPVGHGSGPDAEATDRRDIVAGQHFGRQRRQALVHGGHAGPGSDLVAGNQLQRLFRQEAPLQYGLAATTHARTELGRAGTVVGRHVDQADALAGAAAVGLHGLAVLAHRLGIGAAMHRHPLGQPGGA